MTQGWDGSSTPPPKPGDEPTPGTPAGSTGPSPSESYPPPGYPPPGYPTPGYPAQGYQGQPGWALQAYAQGAYAQPPTAQGPTGYPQAVYPSNSPPPPAGYPPPAYPPPGYPGGSYPYPAAPAKPRKPGVVTAAAVLAFVQAGIILIAGVTTLNGASALSDLDFGVTRSSGSLTVLGVLALVAGGLLIAGGVSVFNKRPWLLVAGAALSLVLSVWWMVQWDFVGIVLTWALLLAVMPIISISLVLSSTAKTWMKTSS